MAGPAPRSCTRNSADQLATVPSPTREQRAISPSSHSGPRDTAAERGRPEDPRRPPRAGGAAVPGSERETTARRAPPTTATASRCWAGGRPPAAARAAPPAPLSPPRLKPAWNAGIRGRARVRHTSTAATFTVRPRLVARKPRTNRPAASSVTLRVRPSAGSARQYPAAYSVVARRAPTRAHTRAANGAAAIIPALVPDIATPSALSRAPIWSASAGRRVAHELIPVPRSRKTVNTAVRGDGT